VFTGPHPVSLEPALKRFGLDEILSI
jgi:hypothetical protein